jgi:hypothetical protein
VPSWENGYSNSKLTCALPKSSGWHDSYDQLWDFTVQAIVRVVPLQGFWTVSTFLTPAVPKSSGALLTMAILAGQFDPCKRCTQILRMARLLRSTMGLYCTGDRKSHATMGILAVQLLPCKRCTQILGGTSNHGDFGRSVHSLQARYPNPQDGMTLTINYETLLYRGS